MPHPFHQDRYATIYHGDCWSYIKRLVRSEAVLILADPPYGLGLRHDNKSRGRGYNPGHGDQICTAQDYPPVIGDDKLFEPGRLVCFPNIVLWGANNFANKLPPSPKWFAWDKRREEKFSNDGSDIELAWVQGGNGIACRIFRHLWSGCVRDSERRSRLVHPTQKPIALMEWCIHQFAHKPIKLVVDPFMGSGPTLIAAKRLGLKSVGWELSLHYCRIAARRLRQCPIKT